MGLFDKGFKKTNQNFFQKLSRAIVGKSRVDEDVLDAIEEALLSSDMGVETTLKLIENLEDRVEKDKYMSMDELVDILRDEIAKLLNVSASDAEDAPVVVRLCQSRNLVDVTAAVAVELVAQGFLGAFTL